MVNLASFRGVSSVVPPRYNSVVEYNCARGYWLGPWEFSRRIRCAEDGLWDPPINFTCSGELLCFLEDIVLLGSR